VRNVIFLTGELVLITENHECCRSPKRWKCWLNRTCDSSGVRTRSSHGMRVLSTTENFWVIPGQREVYRETCTSRSFSANYRRHQQIIWTSNDGDWKFGNSNRRAAINSSSGVLHLLDC